MLWLKRSGYTMSDAELLTLGVAALGVAGLGLTVSTVMASVQLAGHLRQRAVARDEFRALASAQEEATVIDLLRNDIMVLEMEYQFPERPVNYRHNVHCPKCGRFARRVFEGNDIVFCKVHEMQVDWKHMPVDWASAPSVSIQGVIVHAEAVAGFDADVIHPVTEPIPLLIPDTLSLEQLQDEGAVL